LLGFYNRRIKRLVPALVLFVVINCVLLVLFNPSPEVSLKTGIASLVGSSNLYLLKQSTDYFATSTKLNVFTHTWSLGVEEQFYIFFPLIVWCSGFSRSRSKGSRNLLITVGALSVASLISFVYLYHSNQPAAYFLMPTRFLEIGAGCLMFLGMKHSEKFLRALAVIPPLAITVGVVVVLCLPLRFAVSATIAVVLLTVILIGCIRSGTAVYNLFTHKRLVYIGQISYSLYLWHWGILAISRWTIGIYWWTVPIQIALMLICCIASYKFVETPLRHSNWSFSRFGSINIGLSALLLSSLIVFFLSINAKGMSLIKENKEMSYGTHWEGWSSCNYVETPDPILGGCFYLTNMDYPLRVAVIGDSHAGHLASGLRDVLPSIPSSIAVALYAGCYPVINSECILTQQAYKWVLGDPDIDVVILSAYHNLYVNENRLYLSSDMPNAIPDGSIERLEDNLIASINSLTDSGREPIFGFQ